MFTRVFFPNTALPPLTIAAFMVISTGVFGAVIARFLFNWMRIYSHEVRGFALGVSRTV